MLTQEFFDSIAGQKLKYKRVNDSPLRYAGGKSLAVGFIAEHLPSNLERLVSPFFGGGSFEIALAKRTGIQVLGYDIFEMLTNYWHYQAEQPESLASILKSFEPTPEVYRTVKEKLKEAWKSEQVGLEVAAWYYFNHNLSYGPGFLGWPSSVYMNQKRFDSMIEKVRNFSAPIKVKTGDFKEVMQGNASEFIYADPPYHLSGKMFRGIYPQRNFPIHHNGFDHESLRDLLHNHKGGFVLSYNDTPIIREWYADFEIYEPAWQYTMGQGETRIGKNRTESHVKESHELLIVKKG